MTNLDNIRQMNSEELAKLLKQDSCKHCVYEEECRMECCCEDGIKAWLEQEVTPTLTDDEKVILRNIDKKYTHIKKKDDGRILVEYFVKHSVGDGTYPLFFELNIFLNTPFNSLRAEELYEISKLLGDEDLLGKKGICESCGENGTYQYDPYDLEIHDKEEIVCLCDECYQNRAEEI